MKYSRKLKFGYAANFFISTEPLSILSTVGSRGIPVQMWIAMPFRLCVPKYVHQGLHHQFLRFWSVAAAQHPLERISYLHIHSCRAACLQNFFVSGLSFL